MYIKLCFPLLAFMLLFSACTTSVESDPPTAKPGVSRATTNPIVDEDSAGDPNIPVTGNESIQRGNIEINSLVILVSDGFPPEYQLEVKGALPTPCHQLRTIVDKPNRNSEIYVQVYSVYDPYGVCAQVPSPFDVSLPLGSYVRGSYTVFVNDKQVGEITP
jgi:hypothetical protein